MLTRDRYRGLFAYPPTAFTPDGHLDEDANRSNIRKLIGLGVDGIAMAGTSGEFYTLEPNEHVRLGSILREETAGTPVASMMGAIPPNTTQAVRTTRAMMDLGIDAVFVVQPHYAVLTDRELQMFWREVCGSCPDIGIVIYHYDWIRQPYTLDTFSALADIPNLIGSKEAHWDFNAWKHLHEHSPLVHMSSTDSWTVELLQASAAGVGSLQICYCPQVIAEIIARCNAGDFTAARRLQDRMNVLVSSLKKGQGPFPFPAEIDDWGSYSHQARHKALTEAFGFLQVGPPRRPAIAVPAATVDTLRRYLQQFYADLLPSADAPAPPLAWPRA